MFEGETHGRHDKYFHYNSVERIVCKTIRTMIATLTPTI
jgi:hypothetical protein